jgi:glycosyltransferase involved in cell wall biosynthesis
MNRINVILSTFGPLHLIKSAEFLSQYVDIQVIQGWIPSWWNKWILKYISRYIGYDLSRTIRKRTPECLNNRNIGLGFPEFWNCFCRFFIKNRTIQNKGVALSFKIYGRMSCRYLKDATIFHVRSGSGRGGAIKKARKNGMKILVDHSTIHPIIMDKIFNSDINNQELEFSAHNPLWIEVMKDCQIADTILVNSQFVKDTFIEAGYDSARIKVAYLGVREDFFDLKQDYHINDKLRILFTGGFGFRKGAEYALKAMQELERQGIDYEFIVVGSHDEAQPLIEKYPTKGLKLIGFVPQDDLKEYLATADIYLFPSLCEGCASSGMEAMAAGLPVIATHESGLPIENGKNGIIVPSKDVESIVDAILTLKDNKSYRETLGKAAFQLISEHYTWEKYAEEVTKIYQDLLTE